MLSLALKDIRCVARERAGFAIALFSLMIPVTFANGNSLGLFWCLLPTMYITSWACGVDFKYRADRFLGSLPLSRGEIAAGRYLGIFPAWAATFAVSLPVWFIIDAFGPGISVSRLPYIALLSLSANLFAQALYLGAYYLVGFQNARWAMMVLFGAFAAILAIFGGFSFSSGQVAAAAAGSPVASLMNGTLGWGAYAAILASALALYALSFALAAAANRRKEF